MSTVDSYFKYTDWDEVGDYSIMVYDVIILKDFGKYKKGAELESVYVDFDSGVIEVYKNDKVDWSGKIDMRIVENEKISNN